MQPYPYTLNMSFYYDGDGDDDDDDDVCNVACDGLYVFGTNVY